MIFDKINCSKIPFKDKGCHFIVGFCIVIFLYFLKLGIYSLLAIFIIGISKELYDKYIRKTFFDVKDVLATTLGGFSSYLLILIL